MRVTIYFSFSFGKICPSMQYIYQSANQNQLVKMQRLVSRRYKYTKKSLDEAEHDFMNYQC